MVNLQRRNIKDIIYNTTVRQFVFVFFLSIVFVYSFMYRILDSRQVIIFATPVFIYWMIGRKRSPYDLPFLFLFIAYFLMGIYEHMTQPGMNYLYNVKVYTYIMPITYLLGKMCVGEEREATDKKAIIVLNVINAGMFGLAVLDYIKKYVENDTGDIRFVGWRAFWNDEYVVKNEVDFGFYIMIAAIFFAFVLRKEHRLFWNVVVCSELFILINSFIVRGRSNYLFIFGAFCFSLLVYIFTNKINADVKKRLVYLSMVFIVVFFSLVILMKLNVFSLGALYEKSFLNRDGGILHNVRFAWNIEGLKKIFLIQKGGWIVESNTYKFKTHSSWLEYGRNYDIFIYVFLMTFCLLALIRSFVMLIKYNKEHKVLFYSFAAQLMYFIYFCLEPMGYNYRDEIIIYVFLAGLNGGIRDNIKDGRLFQKNYCKREKNYIFDDIGIVFLFLAMVSQCYIDWWNDGLNVFTVLVIPCFVYILPSIVRDKNTLKICTLLVAGIAVVTGLYRNGRKIGFVDAILALAILFGGLFSKFKTNKIVTFLITLLLFITTFWSRIIDGRLEIIKRALNLTFKYKWGSPWGVSGLMPNGVLSSSNVWLNYSRDYGLLVFALLGLFYIWMIIEFFRYMLSEKKEWFDYAIIIAFILYNFYFMISDIAYDYKYIIYINLYCCGMIIWRNRYTGNDTELIEIKDKNDQFR